MKKIIKRIAAALMALLAVATFAGCSWNPLSTSGTESSDSGPAKEEKVLDVILLAGQSNALGLSDWSDTAVYYDNVSFFGFYGEGSTMTNRGSERAGTNENPFRSRNRDRRRLRG